MQSGPAASRGRPRPCAMSGHDHPNWRAFPMSSQRSSAIRLMCSRLDRPGGYVVSISCMVFILAIWVQFRRNINRNAHPKKYFRHLKSTWVCVCVHACPHVYKSNQYTLFRMHEYNDAPQKEVKATTPVALNAGEDEMTERLKWLQRCVLPALARIYQWPPLAVPGSIVMEFGG